MFDADTDDADDRDARHDAGELTPAQREFAGALRGLRPAAPAPVNRDRLLFEAGAAAARRSVFRWRAAAAVLLLGNATLMGVALRSGDSPTGGGTRVVQATPPVLSETRTGETSPADGADVPNPNANALLVEATGGNRWPGPMPIGRLPVRSADAGYLSVRDAVLREGVSALPAPSVRTVGDVKPLEIEELLGT